MPPIQLIRFAVALVWLYEGLWCKVLGRQPQQEAIVSDVPLLSAGRARGFLFVLGWAEGALGVWVLTGRLAWWAALTQTVLLSSMNAVGLLFARRRIHDPAGMVCKNLALLVLAWVAAGLGG
jgi:uncharacterized membrane protein YphA (DoxX/SURF4 family)